MAYTRQDTCYKKLNNSFKSSMTSTNPFDDCEGFASEISHSSRGPGLGTRMNPEQIRAQQQQIIAEQDKGLDAISEALRRQRRIGLAIQDEVTEHNVLIDEISSGTSHADGRIRRETQRIERARAKESSWCPCVLWSIVILLAVAIVVIAVVPYNGKP